MKSWIGLTLAFILLGLGSLKAFADPLTVRFVQGELRYGYEVELLRHALKLTEASYGPAKATHIQRPQGVSFEQALVRGEFDIAFLPTSARRELRLRAVQVPLLQGMLGYRLLLIRPGMESKFASAQGIEDFKSRLIGGVGLRWEDFRIFSRNQILVKTSTSHLKLFDMLTTGEVDYFARGVNEVFGESVRLSKYYKEFKIHRDIAFFYPFPFYFFVRQNNSELALRIEEGLRRAEADGSFKAIFLKHFHDDIEQLKELKVKQVLYLENPSGQSKQPMKFDWWLEQPPPEPMR